MSNSFLQPALSEHLLFMVRLALRERMGPSALVKWVHAARSHYVDSGDSRKIENSIAHWLARELLHPQEGATKLVDRGETRIG